MSENQCNVDVGGILPFPSPPQSPDLIIEDGYLSPKFYETRELVHGGDGELVTIEQLIKDDFWETHLDDEYLNSTPRKEFANSGGPVPETGDALLPLAFISGVIGKSDLWDDQVDENVRTEAAQCAFNEYVLLITEHNPEKENDVRSIWMSAGDLLWLTNRAIEIANFGR